MKKIILYIVAVLFVGGLTSCADLEDVQPLNSIPADQAINNQASAEAALNGVYSAMQDADLFFDGYLALAQFFTDEANATGTFPTRLEFGNLNVFPSNTTMAVSFTELYIVINNANNVIELVPLVEDANFTQEERNSVVAEAKFIRAHSYLHLTSLWKDVPLILSPTRDVGEALNVAASSQDAIYAQISSDLTEAAANLTAETSISRASKQSANALLARLALYQGNWAEAKAKAAEVLGADFDLSAVPFLEDQIFSLNFTSTDGNNLAFYYGPSDFGGRYSIGPTATLINSFEEGDARFAATLDTSSASVPFGLKYPSFAAANAGTATDPVYFIRHAEMVLISAEAEAEMGNFEGASACINQVRTRAGLAPITLDANNFVDAILQERFVEFAFEGSQRLVDLRRKGKAEAVLGGIGYDACDAVWPLPQRDVDRNLSLSQNNCCNC